MLERFIEEVNRRELCIEGIRILKGGSLLAEHRWTPEVPRLIHSCSKSFTSAAVGIAMEEGLFSPEDSVIGLLELPQYAGEWAELKIKHLLTMTSGHEEGTMLFEERGNLGDWMEAFFRKKRVYPCGEHFVYNNGCTYLISAIIQKLSGEKLSEYLQKRLFVPMGFGRPYWAECPAGRTQGLTGLHLTTTQMGEFGQLLLDKGRKDGKQLIPEQWIAQATAKQVETQSDEEPDWSKGYGYFFWRSRHDCWRADGMLGQFIIVIERLGVVIAVSSNEPRMQEILDLIWQYILPQL